MLPKPALWSLLALIALTTTLLAAPRIEAQSAETVRVQIQARMLASGQIEFGVRVGDTLILPHARFFPTNAVTNRWLQTSEFKLASAQSGRVIARRLANEQVKFGLRVVGEGDYFPANGTLFTDLGFEGWITSGPILIALDPIELTSAESAPSRERTIGPIQHRGALRCGVKTTQPLFGYREADGTISGFDIEFCKALAAALEVDLELVDASDASIRFELLNDGAIDVLFRTTMITAARDRELGVDFAQTTFYSGQGFAVRKDSGIKSTADMSGRTICVLYVTTTELNLADHFRDIGLTYTPLSGSYQDTQDAFRAGRCEVWTADRSYLGSLISVMDNADDFVILGQVISKEPLAPGVRDYNSEWKDVVNWVVHGLIAAEELGITQSNVAALASNPPSTTIARLLGVPYEGGEVSTRGFDLVGPQFIQRAIAAVGNYGEIYARTIGDYIPRACSLNALAIDDSTDCPPGTGGILYALPYR